MPAQEFVPVVPAGFEIAGSFNGVTTAVAPGGVPRIRYRIHQGVQFRSGGLIGFATRQVLKRGVGDEVLIGSLHTRLATALMLVGVMPEAGLVERLDSHPIAALVVGRYNDHKTEALRYGAMALVRGRPGIVEVLVTECDSEAASRELINAAMAPYL
ncbi:MAG TPA: hypothetical protein VLK30_11940 [Candidatus Limnocylindrales bacterium]|nr:hypothetical protein [Candidatus Limnocylindrales bacterium]